MEKLKIISNEAYEWLLAREPEGWCLAYYSERACNSVQVNSMSEWFNNWIADGRDLPIYDLCEFIRTKIMTLFVEMSVLFQNYGGRLCAKIQMEVENIKKCASTCRVIACGDDIFEVKEKERTTIVNIREKHCPCLEWQLNDIPCKHAVAVFQLLRLAPEDFVGEYYTVETHRKIYGRFIKPVGSKDTWPVNLDFEKIRPPTVRKPPGRPRVGRRISKAEGLTNPYKKNSTKKCVRCLKVGHNIRSCPAPLNGETKKQPKKSTKGMPLSQPGPRKGKKSGYVTTEEQMTELMDHRRKVTSAAKERRTQKRNREECTEEEIAAKREAAIQRFMKKHGSSDISENCTEEEIAANREATLERFMKTLGSTALSGTAREESSSHTKRQKLTRSAAMPEPVQPADAPSTEEPPQPVAQAPQPAATIGLAQQRLNELRSGHQAYFTTAQDGRASASRYGSEAMFTRGRTGRRGRSSLRGRRDSSQPAEEISSSPMTAPRGMRGSSQPAEEISSSPMNAPRGRC